MFQPLLQQQNWIFLRRCLCVNKSSFGFFLLLFFFDKTLGCFPDVSVMTDPGKPKYYL